MSKEGCLYIMKSTGNFCGKEVKYPEGGYMRCGIHVKKLTQRQRERAGIVIKEQSKKEILKTAITKAKITELESYILLMEIFKEAQS